MRRLAALLLAGFAASASYAQAPNERGRDQQDQARGNSQATSAHKMHHLGVDREAAIGHALDMAIEGSVLWHCAQKVEAQNTKTDRNARTTGNQNQAMRDPGGVLEQHARDAFRASERLFQAVMQDEKENNPQNGAANASNAREQGADHMGRHQACEEFYRAARDYSRALETSCSNTRQAGAQAAPTAGRTGDQASTASISSDVCAENTAKVALINHAVKDAVEGVALHQMLRHHGERDRTSQALESHAEQMIASSRHAIDSIDQEGAKNHQSSNAGRQSYESRANKLESLANKNQAREDRGTVRRDAARPTFNDERAHSDLKAGEAITVHQLAKLGREVIRSVNRLNQNQDQMKK